MISTTHLLMSFVICLVFSGIGFNLAIKRKKIIQSKNANIAIWLLLGFTSFIFSLISSAIFQDAQFFDEIILSVVLGYYLADAEFLREKK